MKQRYRKTAVLRSMLRRRRRVTFSFNQSVRVGDTGRVILAGERITVWVRRSRRLEYHEPKG